MKEQVLPIIYASPDNLPIYIHIILCNVKGTISNKGFNFRSKGSSSSSHKSNKSKGHGEGEKNARQRTHTYVEIYETEVQYAKDVALLIDLYVLPLQAACKGNKEIISREDITLIFSSSLPLILETSNKLLQLLLLFKDLKSSNNEDKAHLLSACVCNAFSEVIPLFKIYAPYFIGYEKGLQNLKDLELSKPLFAKFLGEAIKKPESRGLSLGSFLIKPVQRICKYPLFFNEVRA
jgi:hypothetical protein